VGDYLLRGENNSVARRRRVCVCCVLCCLGFGAGLPAWGVLIWCDGGDGGWGDEYRCGESEIIEWNER
jgi:hypothetical protein